LPRRRNFFNSLLEIFICLFISFREVCNRLVVRGKEGEEEEEEEEEVVEEVEDEEEESVSVEHVVEDVVEDVVDVDVASHSSASSMTHAIFNFNVGDVDLCMRET